MKRDLFLLRSIAVCKLIRDNSHLSSYLPKAFLPVFVFMTVFIGLSFAANAAETIRVNIPRVTVTMARSYNFNSAANSVYVPVEFNSTMSADEVADYIEESNAFLFDHFGDDVVEISGVSDDFDTIYLDIKPNTGIKRVLLITSTGSGSVVERNDYYPLGMRTATGNSYPQLTTNLYKYNGKEMQTIGSLGFTDYGARMYDDFTDRWFVPDPLAEKYASMSPYTYCSNNPIIRIDHNGMDDYRYDDKTGQFHLMKQTDDKTDRVLGYHLNKKTGEYEQNTKWYQTKIRMEGVEKGILSDGANFMSNNNIIAVGGEGQASVDGVEAFAVNLSDMVRKEIASAYFSKDGAGSITHISIGRYEKNSYKETKGGHGHILWNRLYPDSKLGNSLTGFFHTHPSGSNISVSDRTQPSQQDKKSRDAALKLMPNLQFYILTHPINYGDKFPYKILYTSW